MNCVDLDGAIVATASDDRTAKIWAHGSTASTHVLEHAAEVNAVSLAPEVVVTGCYDTLLRVFAVTTGQLLRTLAGHRSEVLSVCVRDGVIVSGAVDNVVRVWSMEEEAPPVAVLEGHSGPGVNGVALAPGAGFLASMSNEEVMTWQPAPIATASSATSTCGSSRQDSPRAMGIACGVCGGPRGGPMPIVTRQWLCPHSLVDSKVEYT